MAFDLLSLIAKAAANTAPHGDRSTRLHEGRVRQPGVPSGPRDNPFGHFAHAAAPSFTPGSLTSGLAPSTVRELTTVPESIHAATLGAEHGRAPDTSLVHLWNPTPLGRAKGNAELHYLEQQALGNLKQHENITADPVAEALINLGLTAGIGGVASLGRAGAEVGASELAGSAASDAAGGAEGGSLLSRLGSAAQAVRNAPTAAREAPGAIRDAAEALATKEGARAAAARVGGAAAGQALEHPKLAQIGGLGALGAVSGKKEGGLQIPTALVQGTAGAVAHNPIGTAEATGKGLAGIVASPFALGQAAVESAIHGTPKPLIHTAEGQGEGILDLLGKLASGNPKTVQETTEKNVGLSLLTPLPHLLDSDRAAALTDAARGIANDARGKINDTLGTDLRHTESGDPGYVFSPLERRAIRRRVSDQESREVAPENLIGGLNAKEALKESRKLPDARSLRNRHGFEGGDAISTVGSYGLSDPAHVALLRALAPEIGDVEEGKVNLGAVLEHLEKDPSFVSHPKVRQFVEKQLEREKDNPYTRAGKGDRAKFQPLQQLLGVRDAVDRIPAEVERLLPEKAGGWSREDAWQYIDSQQSRLEGREGLNARARRAEHAAEIVRAEVKGFERDERRRQRRVGAKRITTEDVRRSDLPMSSRDVLRPAVKSRGPHVGEVRLGEQRRLGAKKEQLVDLQADARGKRVEAAALKHHIEELKRGPLSELSRPWHAVSSRARRRLWTPELEREAIEETKAAMADPASAPAAAHLNLTPGSIPALHEPFFVHQEKLEPDRIRTMPSARGGNSQATTVPKVRASDESSLAYRDQVDRSFGAFVHGTILDPHKRTGLQAATRNFVSEEHLPISVERNGKTTKAGAVTREEAAAAKGRGELPKDAVWIPISDVRQPYIDPTRKLRDSTERRIAEEVAAHDARRKVESPRGYVFKEEAYKEHVAQVNPTRWLGEKFINGVSRGAGAILLMSPAWVASQTFAELLPMLLSNPRAVIDPAYAAKLQGAIRDAREMDPYKAKVFAASMGEAARFRGVRENAPGYEPTFGQFADLPRALEHDPATRWAFSAAKGDPFFLFDHWRQGKYRTHLAAAELDKELHGFFRSMKRTLRGQQQISHELRDMPLAEAMNEVATNPRYKTLLDQMHGYVNDMQGNWHAFTRFERTFAPAAIFYSFLRYAYRWPLAFARHHPIAATASMFLGDQNAVQIEKLLGGKQPTSFLDYTYPVVQNAKGERNVLPIGSRTAMLSGVTQGSLEGNLPEAAIGSLNPVLAAVAAAVTGTDNFGEQHSGEEEPLVAGLHLSLAAKELMTTPPLLRALGVGESHSQTAEELHANDPERLLRSFAVPTIQESGKGLRRNNEIIESIEAYDAAKAANGGYAPSSGSSNPFSSFSGVGSGSANPFSSFSGLGGS